jgi:hypothetical protein
VPERRRADRLAPRVYAEAEATMGQVEALFMEVLGAKYSFTWQIWGNRAFQIAR